MRSRLAIASAVALLAALLTVPANASPALRPAAVTPAAAKPAVAKPAVAKPAVAKAVASPSMAAAVAVAPTRTRTYDGGLLGGTFRTNVHTEAFSSAAVGNLTGHRDGDTDVVAAYVDGSIHVWSERTGRQEFVVQTGSAIRASPALVRTRAGGGLVLLTANDQGNVYIFGFTGGVVRTLFHKHVVAKGVNGFFGTPTLADLDRNGKMYVVATSFDQHLYVWDLAGHDKPGFPYWAQDTIWSSPTVAVVDGDPYPEIIFGYDCGGSGAQRCYQKWHNHGGVLIAIKHNGAVAPGWPVFIPGQVVWSTPAVASLFGGTSKQIVVGTGLFYPNAGRETRVYDAHGHLLRTIPMYGRTFSSPAIGDVLGIGSPQIVIGDELGNTDILDNVGHRAVHVCTARLNACVTSHSSPIVGDLYGNGQQEVVAVGGNSFYIIDRTRKVVFTGQIRETQLGLAASPTLVNIAGKATLYFTLMAKGAGGNRAEVVKYTFPTRAGASSWPMFKGNAGRTGTYAKVVPAPLA